MLTKFKVENFKSIHSLELELGRVNVFIGENGSGKSNVLEAVALASAAAADRLDNEFLAPRGIRVPNPLLMTSAFAKGEGPKSIDLIAEIDSSTKVLIRLDNENLAYTKWNWTFFRVEDPRLEKEMLKAYSAPFLKRQKGITKELRKSIIESIEATIHSRKSQTKFDEANPELVWFRNFEWDFGKLMLEPYSDFLIYAPEYRALRLFVDAEQILPLGISGQGLFRLLQKLSAQPDQPAINELNQHLKLFSWFDSFSLPERLWPGESFLKIKDKYLDANIEFVDQRSANEGFLFVLFYLSLFISKDTPKFFAIDNIETSLNPKICTKLMTTVAELAKTHDKQVMITTHSPAILDGIDLNDDEQRLFLVYRNKLGHTVAKRVSKPEPLPGQIPAKLSELFMMGHLGGLPKNFSL